MYKHFISESRAFPNIYFSLKKVLLRLGLQRYSDLSVLPTKVSVTLTSEVLRGKTVNSFPHLMQFCGIKIQVNIMLLYENAPFSSNNQFAIGIEVFIGRTAVSGKHAILAFENMFLVLCNTDDSSMSCYVTQINISVIACLIP